MSQEEASEFYSVSDGKSQNDSSSITGLNSDQDDRKVTTGSIAYSARHLLKTNERMSNLMLVSKISSTMNQDVIRRVDSKDSDPLNREKSITLTLKSQ